MSRVLSRARDSEILSAKANTHDRTNDTDTNTNTNTNTNSNTTHDNTTQC